MLFAGRMKQQIGIRIRVTNPLKGVTMQVQRGKCELLPPIKNTASEMVFEFDIDVDVSSGVPNFLGAYAQGPKDARFVYVNSGAMAGDAADWQRRAKVPLRGLTWALAEEAARTPGAVLAARIAGKAKDGGPVCASIPLLAPGWHVAVLE